VNSTEDDTENGRKTVQEQRMKRMKRNIYTPNYEVFWKEYPKKSSSKKAAFDQWNKLNGNRPTIETIIEAIKNKSSGEETHRPGNFARNGKTRSDGLKTECGKPNYQRSKPTRNQILIVPARDVVPRYRNRTKRRMGGESLRPFPGPPCLTTIPQKKAISK